MSIFLTLVPVYAQSPYFLVAFSHNCTICLCEHTNPQILICGHIFCKECIEYCKNKYKRCVSCSMFITKSYNVKFIYYKEITCYSTIMMKKCDSSALMIDDIKNKDANPFCIPYYDSSLTVQNDKETSKNEKNSNNEKNNYSRNVVCENIKLQGLNNIIQNKTKTNDSKNVECENIKLQDLNSIIQNKTKNNDTRNVAFENIKLQDFNMIIQNKIKNSDIRNVITQKIYTWNDLDKKIKQIVKEENESRLVKCTEHKTNEKKTIEIEINEETCKHKLNMFYDRYKLFTKVKTQENVFVRQNYDFLNVADKILQNYTKLEPVKNEENIECSNNTITEQIRKQNLEKRKNEEKIRTVFYQSADGQQYYMQAKDVQKIIQKYKDYNKLPEYIFCKILKIQKELHKSNKYLSHLPTNKKIHFCTLCFDL
ncbi:hypothetical protein BDAP_000874 [Binucleata daphniae]